MGNYVDVSSEELYHFAEYIENFSRLIDSDCEDLRAALSSLSSSMDSMSAMKIHLMVKQIEKTLTEEEPVLARLREKVLTYAQFIERLQEASRSGGL